MAKSLTVQFTDGSSHTYDNVPDDVTQDQANARASQEFADKRVGAAEAPSTASAPASGAVASQGEPSVGDLILGGLKTAYDVGAPVVAEHPFATSYAASYIPGINQLPIIRDIKASREAVENLAKRATNIVGNAMTGGTPSSAGIGTPSNPIGGSAPSSAARPVPVSGAVAPESVSVTKAPARAPIPTGSNVIQFPGPANAPAQAVQAAENPSLMSRAAQMYRTYAPVVGEKLATAGRAVAPVVETGARMASRVAGPASAMLYSGGLNEGEDQAMARIRAIQDSVGRLPKEQQTMYLNMPADKRQRVDQMILMGANPAALLVPNAINSGFAQELKKLGR